MTDRRVLASGDAGTRPVQRRRRSDVEAQTAALPQAQEAKPADARKPAVYRLLAANLDASSDGGCDLIFVSDAEAMGFARTMSEFAACIQVWCGTRLVGLACAPEKPDTQEQAD